MNALLSKETGKYTGEGYPLLDIVPVRLPMTAKELNEAMVGLGYNGENLRQFELSEYHVSEFLQGIDEFLPNVQLSDMESVDMLNEIAYRISGMDELQCMKVEAIADLLQSETKTEQTISQWLSAISHMDSFDFMPDVFNLYELGDKTIYGDVGFDHPNKSLEDCKRVGEIIKNANGGFFTSAGYIAIDQEKLSAILTKHSEHVHVDPQNSIWAEAVTDKILEAFQRLYEQLKQTKAVLNTLVAKDGQDERQASDIDMPDAPYPTAELENEFEQRMQYTPDRIDLDDIAHELQDSPDFLQNDPYYQKLLVVRWDIDREASTLQTGTLPPDELDEGFYDLPQEKQDELYYSYLAEDEARLDEHEDLKDLSDFIGVKIAEYVAQKTAEHEAEASKMPHVQVEGLSEGEQRAVNDFNEKYPTLSVWTNADLEQEFARRMDEKIPVHYPSIAAELQLFPENLRDDPQLTNLLMLSIQLSDEGELLSTHQESFFAGWSPDDKEEFYSKPLEDQRYDMKFHDLRQERLRVEIENNSWMQAFVDAKKNEARGQVYKPVKRSIRAALESARQAIVGDNAPKRDTPPNKDTGPSLD